LKGRKSKREGWRNETIGGNMVGVKKGKKGRNIEEYV
jgi:hypothetical protein